MQGGGTERREGEKSLSLKTLEAIAKVPFDRWQRLPVHTGNENNEIDSAQATFAELTTTLFLGIDVFGVTLEQVTPHSSGQEYFRLKVMGGVKLTNANIPVEDDAKDLAKSLYEKADEGIATIEIAKDELIVDFEAALDNR